MKKIINFIMVAFAAVTMLSCSGNKATNQTENTVDSTVVVTENDSLNVEVNDSTAVVETDSVKVENIAE